MPQPKMLEQGETPREARDAVQEVDVLRRENLKLHSEVDELKAKLAEAERQLLKLRVPVKYLREELEPLYTKLQAVMGHIELTGVEADPTPTPMGGQPAGSSLQPPNAAAWKMWQDRLPGACSDVIDALLISPLTATQLMAAAKKSHSTIQRALEVLRSNALIEKNGDRVSLKRL